MLSRSWVVESEPADLVPLLPRLRLQNSQMTSPKIARPTAPTPTPIPAPVAALIPPPLPLDVAELEGGEEAVEKAVEERVEEMVDGRAVVLA